jgi:hypothetical protein
MNCFPLPKKSTFVIAFLGIGTGSFLFSSSSVAHLGTVRSIAPESLPSDSQFPREYDQVTLPSAPQSVTQLPSFNLPVDRPWILDTPAGPTAYTLDRQQVEFAFNFRRISQMLEVMGPYVGSRFGITDQLSADGEISTQLANLGLRWNFANSGPWAYSIRPWVGIKLKSENSGSYSNEQNSPLGIEISASKVLDDENRLHFAFEGGHNTNQWSYSSSSYSTTDGKLTQYYYSNQYNKGIYAARLSAAYEHRISRKSGFVFWLAPEYTSLNSSSNYNSTGWTSSTNSSGSQYAETALGLQLGTGYQFLGKNFGTSIGLSLGPTSVKRNYENSSSSPYYSAYGYSTIDLRGALTGSVVYKL